MKPMHRQLFLTAFSLAFCFSAAFSENGPLGADQIRQINAAIKAKGAKWVAAENWITRLPIEERRKLYGARIEHPNLSKTKMIRLPAVENLPSHLDWRDNNGNWVTPVKFQGNCGSCWDFAATAQVEAWWKIHNSRPDSMIDLSEQFILSCGNVGNCDGGGIVETLEFFKQTGVPSEACMKYATSDSVPCGTACVNWQDESVKIPGWGLVTWNEANLEFIKNAVYLQPVSVDFLVYKDWLSYSSGVYEHVWGNFEGAHAVLLVGWDDAEQSWICKNSSGETWGDKGYFRIKWGECKLGRYTPIIWDELTGIRALSVSPDHLERSVTLGDSLDEMLTVTNSGSNVLEFSATDLHQSVTFHPDTTNAWDGLSWWCGDHWLGGYDNGWLQYLDTPILDLSGATSSRLSCMVYWAVDNGFDGCNIWISIDGGKTFKVVSPTSPKYNCESLRGFHGYWSLDMGRGIPGWTGISDGWVPMELDLPTYSSDSVVVRFAFASDPLICTADSLSLTGFFVDDIKVSEGNNVIFDEHGDGINVMQRTGFGWNDLEWMKINPGVSVLEPQASVSIDLSIRTADLEPGLYSGLIRIDSNDSTGKHFDVPCRLEVKSPEHDLALKDIKPSENTLHLLFPNVIETRLVNYGLNDENDLDVVCMLLDDNQIVYADTVHVPTLAAGTSRRLHFDPIFLTELKKYNLSINILNPPQNDYNSRNNTYQASLTATNLLDDFESESGHWILEGGWGITNVFGGRSGTFAAQVNSGKKYEPNMDAVMTFERGFNFYGAANPILKFWTKYSTVTDKDVLYVESSSDSLTWVKIDSLTGNIFKWTQESVNLTPIVQSGGPTAWVRFHFIARSTMKKMGFLIDDVEIYADAAGAVDEKSPSPGNSLAWNLAQNYPNPFNSSTTINFTIPSRSHVALKVFDLLGREVATLRDEMLPAGAHSAVYDAANLTTGIYFVRISAGEFDAIKKLLVIR